MDKESKIKEIVNFITAYPESTASQAILRRHFFRYDNLETSKELALRLSDLLQQEGNEEVDFCYYLIK